MDEDPLPPCGPRRRSTGSHPSGPRPSRAFCVDRLLELALEVGDCTGGLHEPDCCSSTRPGGPSQGRTGRSGMPTTHSPCRGSDRGRAFDEPHVELERHQGRGGARDREEVGARSMTPAAKAIIDVKIGLRTHRKGPVVTRSVRSSGSTPARHELPMTSWAQTVPAKPAPAHASPRMTATSPRSESTGSRSPDAWRAAPTPTAAVPIRRARPLRTSKTPAPSAGRPARSSRIATCGTPAGTARRR